MTRDTNVSTWRCGFRILFYIGSKSATSPVRIGVLLLAPIQLLDVSVIDLFGMLTGEYLNACRLPQPLINGALPIEVAYISEQRSGFVADCTSKADLRLTTALEDPESAPGQLSILLLPALTPQWFLPKRLKASSNAMQRPRRSSRPSLQESFRQLMQES